MQSPYFISVDPSLAKLSMFFGRRQEIRAVRNCVLNGDSILLIGERRMGKTFLLRTVAGLPNTVESLQELMLDKQTAGELVEFHNFTRSFFWPYVALVTDSAGFYFQVLRQLSKEQVGHSSDFYPLDHVAFVNATAQLSESLSANGQRAVILVDEIEKLLELADGASVLSSLKAVIQRCDAIDFILAGDVKPHQETQEFANLKGALRCLYLGPLEPADAMALVQLPMMGQVSFEEQVLQRVLGLTGAKPGLIQILCDHLYSRIVTGSAEAHISLADFDELWDAELRDRMFESFDAPLRDFYDGLQGDEKAIFAFLAHHPQTVEEDIAAALRIDLSHVRKGLRYLKTTHRAIREGQGFRVGAGIVEEFGARFVTCPPIKSSRAMLQPQTLADLLMGESVNVEYKSSLRWDMELKQVNPVLEKVVTKTVAAFLNSEGGTLVIGVADDRTVVGIKPDLETLRSPDLDFFERHLRQLLLSTIGAEFSQYEHITFEEQEDKTVCIVQVEPSPRPVYMLGKDIKEFYVRIGNATRSFDIEAAHSYIDMHWSS